MEKTPLERNVGLRQIQSVSFFFVLLYLHISSKIQHSLAEIVNMSQDFATSMVEHCAPFYIELVSLRRAYQYQPASHKKNTFNLNL